MNPAECQNFDELAMELCDVIFSTEDVRVSTYLLRFSGLGLRHSFV